MSTEAPKDTLAGKFFREHCGDCAQCREYMVMFFAEMPSPKEGLCEVGRKMLKEAVEE